MHYFLSSIYNIEFIRIRLKPYAFKTNIVCSHKVSVLLMNYLEGFIDQLLVGHFVFRLECYEECLRARSPDLLQYLGRSTDIYAARSTNRGGSWIYPSTA